MFVLCTCTCAYSVLGVQNNHCNSVSLHDWWLIWSFHFRNKGLVPILKKNYGVRRNNWDSVKSHSSCNSFCTISCKFSIWAFWDSWGADKKSYSEVWAQNKLIHFGQWQISSHLVWPHQLFLDPALHSYAVPVCSGSTKLYDSRLHWYQTKQALDFGYSRSAANITIWPIFHKLSKSYCGA